MSTNSLRFGFLLCVFCLLLTDRSTGQECDLFAPLLELDLGGTPYSVALGDLDGDGDKDIVGGGAKNAGCGAFGCSYFDIGAYIFMNQGNGSYTDYVVYDTGVFPLSTILGDLDGDGDNDVAAMDPYGVAVLLNNGDGMFADYVLYAVVDYYPNAMAHGDLDGDGDNDLALAGTGGYDKDCGCYLGGAVAVLLNNGDGTFAQYVLYSTETGNATSSVSLDDLDGDGDADMVVAGAGDYDEDCSCYLGGGVSVLLNQGNGTFADDLLYGAGDYPGSVFIGDLDGDGDPDLAVSNSNGGSVLTNNGDGTFADPVSLDVAATPVAIGDLDGDGDLDLVAADNESENMLVLLNNGDGTFADHGSFAVGDRPTSFALGDIDGDGDNDLAVGDPGECTGEPPGCAGKSLFVLLNYGNGAFATDVLYGAGDCPLSVTAADLDGDGDLDLATANSDDSDNVSVLLNIGNGTFVDDVLYGAGNNPSAVSAADLDADGDLDLATANASSDNVSVLLNNGDDTFVDDVLYGAGDGPSSMAAADLDGDGDPDLATANRYSDDVSVLLNNGDGTFVDDVLYGAGDGPTSMAAADLDGDGDFDLATANSGTYPSYSDDVSVLLNNGDGTFAANVLYGAGDYPRSVAIGDLDGDGDVDMAVADLGEYHLDGDYFLGGGVSVLLNQGDGTVADHVLYGAGDYPRSVAIGDLDGDGDPDLAVANDDDDDSPGSVIVLLNQGDGTFAADVFYAPAGSDPSAVIAADLDDDGDLDLATANSISDNVSVLLNGCGTAEPPCEGDANGDGTIDPLDSGYVLSRFGCPVGTGDSDCDAADANADGIVDPLDVGYVLSRFGTCQ